VLAVTRNAMVMHRSLSLLAIVALSLCCRGSLGAPLSLMFQVEPRVEDCLYHEIKQGANVKAELIVIRGGKLDVRLKVEAPGSGRLYERLLFSNVDDVSGNVVDTLIKKGHSVSRGVAREGAPAGDRCGLVCSSLRPRQGATRFVSTIP
jgi:hypothetical protein